MSDSLPPMTDEDKLRAENARLSRKLELANKHRQHMIESRRDLERKVISWREAAEEARSECAALTAKVEQLHDLLGGAAEVIWAALGHTEPFGDQEEARTFDSTWNYLGDAVQSLSNCEARLEVRFDEVVTEKNQAIEDWGKAIEERDAARRVAEHYRAMRCAVCGKRVAYVNVKGEVIGWGCADGNECKPEDGSGMPHTPAQEPTVAPDSEMDPFEAADEMYRRWE